MNAVIRFSKGIRWLLAGLGVTLRNFFRRSLTLQYPWEKETPAPRFRGLPMVKDFFNAKTASEKSLSLEKIPAAPCMETCPALTDVRGYVTLAAEGKYREAFLLLKNHYPFPGSLGRVCPAPCEHLCRRGQSKDLAVPIRLIKRHLADWALASDVKAEPPPVRQPERVAVVGGGPSGLAAAQDLARLGYATTVFERLPEAGGMMRYGIPAYRLPRRILDREIEDLKALGVEIETGKALGADFTLESLKSRGFSAFYLAPGLWREAGMKVEGLSLPGVFSSVDFLRDLSLGKPPGLGKSIVVVGGGNSAMDAARSALRLGSRVTLLYRRTLKEMPAHPEEVACARDEGVSLLFLAAPLRFLGKGRLEKIECIRMALGEPDSSGRRRPEPVPGSEFILEADGVILAVGQKLEAGGLPEGLKLGGSGIEVDGDNSATSIPGVFAGGDAVTGPATVISAIAQGKTAALDIHRYLRKTTGREQRFRTRTDEAELMPRFSDPERIHRTAALLPPKERAAHFEEVELPLGENEVPGEAASCLTCQAGLCVGCGICRDVCPDRVISISTETTHEGREIVSEYELDISRCMFCGLCAEECPTGALFMSDRYELAECDKGKLLYDRDRLCLKTQPPRTLKERV
jgi:NADPH-dependent glutamate synthase beta subunit-like oxidoreductase